jgi:hypothetical protein
VQGNDGTAFAQARPLLAEGLLGSLHADVPFASRLARLSKELPAERRHELIADFDIYQARENGVRLPLAHLLFHNIFYWH